MTIVVVQPDELGPWLGVAGVTVGVVLTAGIDWLRTRRAERKQMRHDLLRAGSEVAAAAEGDTGGDFDRIGDGLVAAVGPEICQESQ